MLQLDCDYFLIPPDGSDGLLIGRDATHPWFAAYVTNISRQVNVRESSADRAEGNGAVQGPSYLGGQSVVIDGLVADYDPTVRANRLEAISTVQGALADGWTLRWTEANGHAKQIENLRVTSYSGPKHDDKGPAKAFQIALSAGDPQIYAPAIDVVEIAPGETAALWNPGSAPAAPRLYLHGPFTRATFTRTDTGEFVAVDMTVADGHYVLIDCGTLAVLADGTTNAYGALDFDFAETLAVAPGRQTADGTTPFAFTAAGPGANTRARVEWRPTWR